MLVLARVLGSIDWDWIAVLSPAFILNGMCMLWMIQKYMARLGSEAAKAWESAEGGE